MATNALFSLHYRPETGLFLNWQIPGGLTFTDMPLRVKLHGTHTFYVWSVVDSGEGAPAWAEPELQLTYFGSEAESPGITHVIEPVQVEEGAIAYRVTGSGPRATIMLDIRCDGEGLSAALTIENPQQPGAQQLPLCLTELIFTDLNLGTEGEVFSGHAYGGRTHGYGRLAELTEPGIPFTHGCIGLAFPLVYLHDPEHRRGVELEFMLDGRPTAYLRPGTQPPAAAWAITWSTERLLLPGQVHRYGGQARMAPYTGDPIARMWQWRDNAATRYGLTPPAVPAWIQDANIVFFDMNPLHDPKGYSRLDDPRCRAWLAHVKELGFSTLYAVSCHHEGINWLSPANYDPCELVGGFAAEEQFLAWVHELGLSIYLWMTTVGLDRHTPEVQAHPEWFTHRPNDEFFYAWDSTPATGYVGYAPDADPLATGWRRWFTDQVRQVIGRGYDGIFIDGCIPRASNHARWAWPGESRNGVEEQVCEVADFVRSLGQEHITFVEDASLMIQASSGVTTGRYSSSTPHLMKAHWDHGMGGGPQATVDAPALIPPEMAREYLLIRYACLLPGVLSNDGVGGWAREDHPWRVQSLMAGMLPSMGITEIDMPDFPDESREEVVRRRQVAEELRALLQLRRDDPLVRRAPLSITGVQVDGDAAVVGILRPSADRCLLTLLQFADRPAQVTIRLAEPNDIPAVQHAQAGVPQHHTWYTHELLHAQPMDDAESGSISGTDALTVTLGAYGFRVFELTRM